MQQPTVLVTGAGRGIGRATASAFAARAGRVAINYLNNAEAAGESAELARQAGAADVLLLQGDVADRDDVARMLGEINERWGRLDVVVNNAGYGCPGTLEEVSESDWDRVFAVHVTGAFHVCRASLPLLGKSESGVIVNISSIAGIRGVRGLFAYSCVKATLVQFTKSLAWELADRGIRVNAICPGIVRTDFHEKMTDEQREHNLANRIPLHREGEPAHIAQMILAVVDNDYITGQTVTVDGGLTMRIA